MSFLKNILRRVKRTAQAQVSGQISSFVGRNVTNVTQRATGGLQSRVDSSLNSLKDKAVAAGVRARRSGLDPFANLRASSVARGTIARAKGEKIVDNFKL